MTTDAIKNLNKVVIKVLIHARPPEDLTVSEWADKYRRLSPENSAESGPWRTLRTPYLKEPMDAFTDPKIKRITVVASSQVGKTELMNNMVGYGIDQDPGPMLFVQPTVKNAEDFSKRRLSPMIRDTKPLSAKVSDTKSKDTGNTILQKQYPGGMLTLTGSNSPASLASIPARYVFGDERDRWASSAGTEGDPWELATARTTTFYNAKLVEVSTPTVKGASAIETSYNLGTRETWRHACSECGQWHAPIFNDIKFDSNCEKVKGKNRYVVSDVWWQCPSCSKIMTEREVREAPKKWIAENPEAYEQGHRSFWINAFCSPWMKWSNIILKFLQAKEDPERLQVVYNTLLGQLWENRDKVEDEGVLLARREVYDAELPEGVYLLTAGVDTQGDRLEYEVVGHGKYGETWGIKRGFIMGRPDALSTPDNPNVWDRLDETVLDKTYRFGNGQGLMLALTFLDSGGNHTQEVYENVKRRQVKRCFAIKGKDGDGVPYIRPANQVPIRKDKKNTCWLYTIGVGAGKSKIMSNIQVQEPGPNYCHFPINQEAGYDRAFFIGLLSEKLVWTGKQFKWEKVPGHERNEPLDCRNYAMAAFAILNPDMEAAERRVKGISEPKKVQSARPKRGNGRKIREDEW